MLVWGFSGFPAKNKIPIKWRNLAFLGEQFLVNYQYILFKGPPKSLNSAAIDIK